MKSIYIRREFRFNAKGDYRQGLRKIDLIIED